jgi:nitroreductase
MWDFFETVRHRHSVRRYQTGRAVEAEKLHAILEIACAAPSAGDLQAYRVVAVTDAGVRRALSRAALDQAFVAEAPVCLVFCAEAERSAARYGERGRSLYAVQDATIAAAYAQLAAVAAGMASAWVGSFDESAVRAALHLDHRYTPVALIVVGYPAEVPELTSRRTLSDVVVYR